MKLTKYWWVALIAVAAWFLWRSREKKEDNSTTKDNRVKKLVEQGYAPFNNSTCEKCGENMYGKWFEASRVTTNSHVPAMEISDKGIFYTSLYDGLFTPLGGGYAHLVCPNCGNERKLLN